MKTHILLALTLTTGLAACGPDTPKSRLLQHFDEIEAEAEETHQYVIATYHQYEAEFSEIGKTCPERLPYSRTAINPFKHCVLAMLWDIGGRAGRDHECSPDKRWSCTRREWTEWLIGQTEPAAVRTKIAEGRRIISELTEERARRRGNDLARHYDRLHRPCIEDQMDAVRNNVSTVSWNCPTEHRVSIITRY